MEKFLNKHTAIITMLIGLATTTVYLTSEAFTRFATKNEVSEVKSDLGHVKVELKEDIKEIKSDIKQLLRRK